MVIHYKIKDLLFIYQSLLIFKSFLKYLHILLYQIRIKIKDLPNYSE
jgi:hypothetical protein